MLVAPSTTWLMVSTSPEDVSTMPVPAPSGCALGPGARDWVPNVVVSRYVLTSTTPGSTLAAIAWRSSPPPDEPLDGLSWRGGPREFVVVDGALVLGERNSPHPMPTPAARNTTAATAAATTATPRRRGDPAGAGGGESGGRGAGNANPPVGGPS